MSPDTMMVHIFTWCSEVGRKIIRDSHYDKTEVSLPTPRDHSICKAIAWIIALANLYDIQFGEAIVKRFPRVCPYCVKGPCVCDSKGRLSRNRLGAARTPKQVRQDLEERSEVCLREDITFDWIVNNIKEIYPANKTLLIKGGHAYIVAKLLEEGGELKAAYSQYELIRRSPGHNARETKLRISEEMSDLTAWLVSCWDLSSDNQSLDLYFDSLFSAGCPTCHETPCDCKPYYTSFANHQLLSKFSQELTVLRDQVKRDDLIEAVLQIGRDSLKATSDNDFSELRKRAENVLGDRSKMDPPTSEMADLLNNMIDVIGLNAKAR